MPALQHHLAKATSIRARAYQDQSSESLRKSKGQSPLSICSNCSELFLKRQAARSRESAPQRGGYANRFLLDGETQRCCGRVGNGHRRERRACQIAWGGARSIQLSPESAEDSGRRKPGGR